MRVTGVVVLQTLRSSLSIICPRHSCPCFFHHVRRQRGAAIRCLFWRARWRAPGRLSPPARLPPRRGASAVWCCLPYCCFSPPENHAWLRRLSDRSHWQFPVQVVTPRAHVVGGITQHQPQSQVYSSSTSLVKVSSSWILSTRPYLPLVVLHSSLKFKISCNQYSPERPPKYLRLDSVTQLSQFVANLSSFSISCLLTFVLMTPPVCW